MVAANTNCFTRSEIFSLTTELYRLFLRQHDHQKSNKVPQILPDTREMPREQEDRSEDKTQNQAEIHVNQ